MRFLGRRLHYSITDYLDMPISTFTEFVQDELEE